MARVADGWTKPRTGEPVVVTTRTMPSTMRALTNVPSSAVSPCDVGAAGSLMSRAATTVDIPSGPVATVRTVSPSTSSCAPYGTATSPNCCGSAVVMSMIRSTPFALVRRRRPSVFTVSGSSTPSSCTLVPPHSVSRSVAGSDPDTGSDPAADAASRSPDCASASGATVLVGIGGPDALSSACSSPPRSMSSANPYPNAFASSAPTSCSSSSS